jgi:hypothetical protein
MRPLFSTRRDQRSSPIWMIHRGGIEKWDHEDRSKSNKIWVTVTPKYKREQWNYYGIVMDEPLYLSSSDQVKFLHLFVYVWNSQEPKWYFNSDLWAGVTGCKTQTVWILNNYNKEFSGERWISQVWAFLLVTMVTDTPKRIDV